MTSGLGLLAWDGSLAAAAHKHAQDLITNGRFSHDGTDGSDVGERVSREPGSWTMVGENLAKGMTSAPEAISAWLESPGHRANLLRAEFTHAGAAVLPLPRRLGFAHGFMWVQVYGSPRAGGQFRLWWPW
jgi:uncharacterized protein YkwD